MAASYAAAFPLERAPRDGSTGEPDGDSPGRAMRTSLPVAVILTMLTNLTLEPHRLLNGTTVLTREVGIPRSALITLSPPNRERIPMYVNTVSTPSFGTLCLEHQLTEDQPSSLGLICRECKSRLLRQRPHDRCLAFWESQPAAYSLDHQPCFVYSLVWNDFRIRSLHWADNHHR